MTLFEFLDKNSGGLAILFVVLLWHVPEIICAIRGKKS